MYIKLSGIINSAERMELFGKSYIKYGLSVNEELNIKLFDNVKKEEFKTGDHVVVLGKVKSHSLKVSNGIKRNFTSIVVQNINHK